jgi:type I restriction enzyme S subunit
MTKLFESINRRYNKDEVLAETVFTACTRFLASCGNDKNKILNQLCDTNDKKYYQQLSEVLVHDMLVRNGLAPKHKAAGPDFKIQSELKSIWIEVITPEPEDVPPDWLYPEYINGISKVIECPHLQILKRWTSAFKKKTEKLVGSKEDIGYLKKGLVGNDDIYVIAINSILLRGFHRAFPQINGVSQLPAALEATFGLGPLQYKICREKNQLSEQSYKIVKSVPGKKNEIVTTSFIDNSTPNISAIWAIDLDEFSLLKDDRPMALVHNPTAYNKLPKNFIPSFTEYSAVDKGDYYSLFIENGTKA